jgi:type II secretory ATPase GspE/PulE/Tfp pilus assembly ATPase PilB-like protein
VSIRVLDQSATAFTLKTVGMADSEQSSVKSALAGHSGMILVCGPTGSGKSSTVHAMLRTIDSVERNVITIEDPIEYVLPNASQIEINTRAGITFASVLRSVLRQDPDVISVGEIRDQETAEIALQAAQTGHLVFATVHSGSNEAALLRLIDLGCDPKLIASAINVVLSQRLVRRLCDHCKSRPKYSEAQRAALWKQQVDPECLFGPAGCEHCQQSGFSSRTGVFDIMPMDQALRARLSSGDLHDTTGGRMTRMQVRATQLALTGIIPWEEVLKVSASVE